jgi:hypothetical protein
MDYGLDVIVVHGWRMAAAASQNELLESWACYSDNLLYACKNKAKHKNGELTERIIRPGPVNGTCKGELDYVQKKKAKHFALFTKHLCHVHASPLDIWTFHIKAEPQTNDVHMVDLCCPARGVTVPKAVLFPAI